MSKIKVCDLAKKLNVTSKELLSTLKVIGINSTSHLNVLSDEEEAKVYEYYNKNLKGVDKMPTKKVNEAKSVKKDQPRIIRREIVQVREEMPKNDNVQDNHSDYELKPKKGANPEQFRRSDAQIEKKKAPIPSIQDLFKPKTQPQEVKEEPKAEIKEEPKEVKQEVKPEPKVEEKKVEEPQEKTAQISKPEQKPVSEIKHNTNSDRREWKPKDGTRPQNGNKPPFNRDQQNRPQGRNKPFNNGEKKEWKPRDNRNKNGETGVDRQIKQAFKDSPVIEQPVVKENTRDQFKPKNTADNNNERKQNKFSRNNSGNGNHFSKEHLKELRAGHKVSDLLNDDDSVLLDFYDFERRKKGNKKKKEEVREFEQPKQLPFSITVGDYITVKDLAEKLKKTSADLIKKLLSYGTLATLNHEVDFDTAAIMAEEYGVKIEREVVVKEEDILFDDSEDVAENLQQRPPIVVVMGHVDHGKTSLLDAIRESNVIETEAGGITQHIGASTVVINGRELTFLDTPGHEAFTAMRARGAQVTDIAILVVAADDGIMPQTIEAINHAKAAGVSIIVAINKIDKEAANPDKVKQELMNYGVVPEEWGGDAICVPVSAKKRIGIDNLLETVTLVADVLDLKADPNRQAKGTIIEAKLDKNKGPVATLLVQRGTINVGDTIVAGNVVGHIRAMTDDRGKKIKKAGPSKPAEIIGLHEVPESGETFYVVKDEKLAKQLVEKRKIKKREDTLKSSSRVSLDDLFDKISAGEVKDLNIIVKADVQGSVEAVKQSLEKISNDEVRVKVIHGAAGAVNESDVMLAQVANAIIIGFNVIADHTAKVTAEREGVDIRLYRIIYDAIEDVTAAMKGMLAPKYKEAVTGHAEIRQIFRIPSVGNIAGCYVTDGKITRNSQIRLIREGIVVMDGTLASLKREKDDVKEVAEGYECGMGIEKFNDIKEGDIIEAFVMEEIKQ